MGVGNIGCDLLGVEIYSGLIGRVTELLHDDRLP